MSQSMRKAAIGRNMKRIGLIKSNQQDYAPTKWSNYFDEEDRIQTDRGVFHMYKKGTTGPYLICLHGGGYSGLTWSLFASTITQTVNCRVIAPDLRGHGNTVTDKDRDLSLETMTRDVVAICNKIANGHPIVLIGHSMGGAVAVQAARQIPTVVGLCIIDVVEGTALEALSSMQGFLRGRPMYFKSVQHAIQWCYKGGQTHNPEAARISMPGQIVNLKSGRLAAAEVCDVDNGDGEEGSNDNCQTNGQLPPVTAQSPSLPLVYVASNAIQEEDDEDSDDGQTKDSDQHPPMPKVQKTETSTSHRQAAATSLSTCSSPAVVPPSTSTHENGYYGYGWRIDLTKTERFWADWYTNLSQKFLDVTAPKLLILANINGLDKALTVGQMQGRFQMQVLAKSGHAIQEDQPQKTCECIAGFLIKQQLAQAKSDDGIHVMSNERNNNSSISNKNDNNSDDSSGCSGGSDGTGTPLSVC